MRTTGKRRLAPVMALLGGCAWSMCALSGCQGPEPEPLPPAVKKPATPPFSAVEYIPQDFIKLPGFYRITSVQSGELVTIQGVIQQPGGKGEILGTPEQVHLAGIIAPAQGQPGWKESVTAVQNWTARNPFDTNVRVEQDSRYPTDFNVDPSGRNRSRRMVLIYFKGTSEATKSTEYNLNRMMVRSGWAVVDLYSATSIRVQDWLINDEAEARGMEVTGVKKNHPPMGLWKLGIILAQRQPFPSAKGDNLRPQRVIIEARGPARTTMRRDATQSSSTGTTARTTTGGAGPAPGATGATTPGGGTPNGAAPGRGGPPRGPATSSAPPSRPGAPAARPGGPPPPGAPGRRGAPPPGMPGRPGGPPPPGAPPPPR